MFPQLTVTPTLTGSCSLSFGYSASTSGGSGGSTSFAWTFSGPSTVTPPTSSTQSGTATVGAAGTYTGQVTATQVRPDVAAGQCTATGSNTAQVFAPLAVSLTAGVPTSGMAGNNAWCWNGIIPRGRADQAAGSGPKGLQGLVKGLGDDGVGVNAVEVIAAGWNAGALAQSIVQNMEQHIRAGLADSLGQLITKGVDQHAAEPVGKDDCPGSRCVLVTASANKLPFQACSTPRP